MSDRASVQPSAATGDEKSANPRPRIGPLAIVLILLMAVGSVAMWLGAPIGWIWLAAQGGTPGSTTLAPLLMIAFALPVTIVVIAILLRRLDDWFSQITGMTRDNRRLAVPWMRGMTEHRGARRKTTILDVVMIFSVLGAGSLLAILYWVVKPF